MSRENIAETTRPVNRKDGPPVEKTRRTIPENAPVTQKHLGKLTKRVTRMESKLKWAMQDYLRYHPGVTAAMWSVLCVIVDLVDFRDGLAYPSIEYIQKKADVKSRRTVDNAIRFAHDEGLIFVQSGGLNGRGLKRSSRYAPNFLLILNVERGEIIRNCTYLTARENWAVVGVNFAVDARGCAVLERKKCVPDLERKKCVPKQGTNRRKYATLERKKCVQQRSDNVGGGASLPAPADAGASAPQENQVDPRSIGRILGSSLAEHLGLTWEQLIGLITGRGEPGAVEGLDGLCKSELFNMGKPTAGLLQDKFPSDVGVFGHVVIHGLDGRVTYNEKGANHVQIGRLSPDQWLLLDYRPAPAYLIEVEKQLRESAIGP